MVERMYRVPESPLCLSDGGAVTASQTAIVAFLRLVGLDVPAPRVSLSSYDVRRW
jgi:cell division control protein 7